jgi:pSer/pThr/pTyr-binding forkhead associated (FHA) protein
MNNPTIPEGRSPNQKQKEESNRFGKATIIQGQERIPAKGSQELQAQLVGFLISYSKTDFGEYWEIKEGNKNVIGSGEDCVIRLAEATVSQNHATLTVRRNKNDNRLMFILTDNHSSNGITVNGIDIELTSYECKNFDKIQIGNYELLLIIIDKYNQQLSRSVNFKATQTIDYSSKSLYSDNSTNFEK